MTCSLESPCKLHEKGHYKHWLCEKDGYSPEKRHQAWLNYKNECGKCGLLKGPKSEFCTLCAVRTFKYKGKHLPKWWAKRIKDAQKTQSESPRWVGEGATYWTKHKWLVKINGNPAKCEHCGIYGEKNKGGRWSIQWANISGEYKRSRDDYKGLCGKCHSKFDGKTKNLEDYQHGTCGRYIKGCRCELCRRFKKLYRNGLIKCSDRVEEGF